MKYARIKEHKEIYTRSKHITLVKNELYTMTELKKLRDYYGIELDKDYKIVDIPKQKTSFFFGARFELPIERGE